MARTNRREVTADRIEARDERLADAVVDLYTGVDLGELFRVRDSEADAWMRSLRAYLERYIADVSGGNMVGPKLAWTLSECEKIYQRAKEEDWPPFGQGSVEQFNLYMIAISNVGGIENHVKDWVSVENRPEIMATDVYEWAVQKWDAEVWLSRELLIEDWLLLDFPDRRRLSRAQKRAVLTVKMLFWALKNQQVKRFIQRLGHNRQARLRKQARRFGRIYAGIPMSVQLIPT